MYTILHVNEIGRHFKKALADELLLLDKYSTMNDSGPK